MTSSLGESHFSSWKSLFSIAGISAVLIALLIPIDVVTFIVWPRPTTVAGYFDLLQSNVLLGLVSLDLLYVIDQVLVIPIVLSLYITLRRANESIVTLFSLLALVGVTAIFSANTAVGMLNLSNLYAVATTEAQRSLYLAAGEALMATFAGSSYHVHIILGAVSLVVISVVMLQDKTFSKATAYAGILGNLMTLGLYVPVVGLLLLFLSLAFFEVWIILLARRFVQLGKE